MNTFKKMMVGLVGASFLIGAMVPVSAAPVMPTAPAASPTTGNENVQQVRDDRWRRGPGHGHWGGHRPGPRPGWHGRPYRPGPGYWHGYRGDRYYRHGYRRHNDGWWYPLAAFGAGAIIGGAIAAPPPPPPPVYRAPAYGYSNAHVQWCYNRYRSYRASDNSFQPYNGPRQQCYSPY
ncbi:BA14K family protein [Ochrobactrum vermis]|uniref:Lectin-like protein BA14k n=1 Tax=Ochrobactrum vermis TaxID=1827297 RepID=A0ABU8PIK1_9HYPH|nr:BA14K family protein [Ochrobactrum vermis]PQZ26212.1 BA14K family protein [Ochrobactrum vermis]